MYFRGSAAGVSYRVNMESTKGFAIVLFSLVVSLDAVVADFPKNLEIPFRPEKVRDVDTGKFPSSHEVSPSTLVGC